MLRFRWSSWNVLVPTLGLWLRCRSPLRWLLFLVAIGCSSGRVADAPVATGTSASTAAHSVGEHGPTTATVSAPNAPLSPADDQTSREVSDPGELSIYFVDVEGGQSTVVRFPNGSVMLVDAGIAGERDAGRIADVLRERARADRIDYLLTTHYDADHVGGVPALAALFPVGTFLDHGDSAAPPDYLALVRAAERRVIVPGDRLDVGAVRLDFVSSAGKLLTAALPGAGQANRFCDAAEVRPGMDENGNSVGFVLHYGRFDFVDLADLLWHLEHQLACPENLLGEVDLYLTTHHGLERSGAPQLVRALNPLAAVMNNGARKGGGGRTWNTLSAAPGAREVWQLHLNLRVAPDENATQEQIANLEAGPLDAAHFLVAHVASDGRFEIQNSRNGFARAYQAR